MAQNPQKSIEAIEGYAMVCSNAQTLLKVCQTPACLHHVIPCLPLRSFHLLRLMLKCHELRSILVKSKTGRRFHGTRTREPGLSDRGAMLKHHGEPSRLQWIAGVL